jgi:hypothetical protein
MHSQISVEDAPLIVQEMAVHRCSGVHVSWRWPRPSVEEEDVEHVTAILHPRWDCAVTVEVPSRGSRIR